MAAAAVDLAALLAPERVALLTHAPTRDEILALLAERIAAPWTPAERVAFHTALTQRELLTTTAIGSGVAVPHARVSHLDRCVMAAVVVPAGVAWGARDREPVRIVLGLAVREQERTEHLLLLAAIATRLGDPLRRARLLAATDAPAVIAGLA